MTKRPAVRFAAHRGAECGRSWTAGLEVDPREGHGYAPEVRFAAHKVQSVDILGQEVLNLIRWKVMDMRQKFVSQRTGVQSVDVLGQQVLKLIHEKVMDMRQKFVSQRTGVQSVDVLGQQVLKLIREKVMDMRVACRVSTFLDRRS